MKTCVKCKKTKPTSEFYQYTREPDGLWPSCKKCMKAAVEARREPLPQGMKRCTKCEDAKPLDAFYRSTRAKDGLQHWCKTCVAAVNRAWCETNRERVAAVSVAWREANRERISAKKRTWYETDQERVLAVNRAWYANNRERKAAQNAAWREANPEQFRALVARHSALKRAAETDGHTATDLIAYFAANGWNSCVYCGATGPLTQDHIVPVSRGGAHSLANLVPACRSCNSAKHARLVSEWMPGHWLANVTQCA